MSTKPSFSAAAKRGLAAAEKSIDRLRYDILGRSEPGEALILSHDGYRNRDRLVLRGRVVESFNSDLPVNEATFSKIRNMLRLYESDELPNAEVKIRIGEETHEVITDDEGYYSLILEGIDQNLPERDTWEEATVSTPDLEASDITARILAPGRAQDLSVISDLDDTVIETGATNFLRNWRRVLVETPEERLAVPGATKLYDLLGRGGGGHPIYYVSSSPWNLHGYLKRFLRANDIPYGPMFLKDYGIDDAKFISSAHTDHKIEAVKHLLGFYPDRRFLLVGDDGQKDIDVYTEAASIFPERIAGIFIRDVHGDGRSDMHKKAIDEMHDLGVKIYFGASLAEAEEKARAIGFGD
jgi:phosphatidate phosphatase APP1